MGSIFEIGPNKGQLEEPNNDNFLSSFLFLFEAEPCPCMETSTCPVFRELCLPAHGLGGRQSVWVVQGTNILITFIFTGAVYIRQMITFCLVFMNWYKNDVFKSKYPGKEFVATTLPVGSGETEVGGVSVWGSQAQGWALG